MNWPHSDAEWVAFWEVFDNALPAHIRNKRGVGNLSLRGMLRSEHREEFLAALRAAEAGWRESERRHQVVNHVG